MTYQCASNPRITCAKSPVDEIAPGDVILFRRRLRLVRAVVRDTHGSVRLVYMESQKQHADRLFCAWDREHLRAYMQGIVAHGREVPDDAVQRAITRQCDTFYERQR